MRLLLSTRLQNYWVKCLFSHSPSCHIPRMNVGSHRTYESKITQDFQRPSSSTNQKCIPPLRQKTPKPSLDWSPSKPYRATRVIVPTEASRTSNSTHIYHRASIAFFQPRLPILVTQTKLLQRFKRICLNRASKN